MNQTSAIVIFGLSPFIIMAIIGILFAFYFVASKLQAEDLSYVFTALGIIVVITFGVLIFIKSSCGAIHPTERFDNPPVPLTTFIQDVLDTEKKVCTLITQTDKFIKGDQGSAGHKDPTLVTAAQEAARAAVIDPDSKEVVPLTDCGTPWDASEVANRISRMELTLKMFTGPEIQKTYNATVPCNESFVSGSGPEPVEMADPVLIQRLAAVNAVIVAQQTDWLVPINQKMKDLRSGKASSCDKQKGSAAGQAAVSSSTAPPPGPHPPLPQT
jgi:energy-coupling factor transporter transmembrane protein EcfT